MKDKLKKILFVLFFVFIIAGIGVFVYSVLNNKNVVKEFFDGVSNKNINDYHNGVYTYEEKLGKVWHVYSNCTVTNFTTNIVVMNDVYKVYSGSCLRTQIIDEGKTEDLVFVVDNEKNQYQIKYKDKIFKKNNYLKKLSVVNGVQERMSQVSVKDLDFVIRTTEEEGDYYPFTTYLYETNANLEYQFEYKEEDKFIYSYINYGQRNLAVSAYRTIDERPEYSVIGGYLAVLDKITITDLKGDKMYLYNLALYGENKKYDLKSEFPININGKRIDANSNIYIKQKDGYSYKMIIGEKNTFCSDGDADKDEISYYEFIIKYNKLTNNFDSPEFVKMGKYGDGCTYINKNYFGG